MENGHLYRGCYYPTVRHICALCYCLRRNIVEIILSIAALQKGLYTVVAASLLGSILSNLLLVLGEGRDDTSYLCEGVWMVGSILPNLLLVLGEG